MKFLQAKIYALFFVLCVFSLPVLAGTETPMIGERQVLKQKNRAVIQFVKSSEEFAEPSAKGNLVLSKQKALSKSESSRSAYNQYPVYYRNGIKAASHRFISTGTILVSFGKQSQLSYQVFALENNLEFLKQVNRLYRTGLFKLSPGADLIEVCNKINQNSNIRYASPNWISPRKLR
jgi:hypothetical protein